MTYSNQKSNKPEFIVGHNFLRKYLALVVRGELKINPDTPQIIHVYHDSWCDFNKGGRCNCDPNFRLTDLIH